MSDPYEKEARNLEDQFIEGAADWKEAQAALQAAHRAGEEEERARFLRILDMPISSLNSSAANVLRVFAKDPKVCALALLGDSE